MPWINPQDYRKDRKMFRDDPIADSALVFEPAASSAAVSALEEVG
jgi:hypothetical protein